MNIFQSASASLRQAYDRLRGKEQLHDVQYVTERNQEKPELPDMIGGNPEMADATAAQSPSDVIETATEIAQAQAMRPDTHSEDVQALREPADPWAVLDCPELNCQFTVVGVRNGNIHLLSKNEMGITQNYKIEQVFGANGRPIVEGIAIREVRRAPSGQLQEPRLRGYIDFGNYIGVAAQATLAVEDIIKEGIQAARENRSEIPEHIQEAFGPKQSSGQAPSMV